MSIHQLSQVKWWNKVVEALVRWMETIFFMQKDAFKNLIVPLDM